jgi:A/G-specific adenine glycosylase
VQRGKKPRRQLPIKPLARALIRWFGAEARPLPWRRTADPYAIWVAEIMLQQTQVKTVIPYWERWMRALPDIRALAKARPQTVLKLWEGLGYYSRARNLHRAAQMLSARDRGRFPEHFEAVLALPGVGRYTAGAICSIAFNQPTPVLDGNVMRVLTRLFAIAANPRAAKTNAHLWELSEQLVRSAASLPSPQLGDGQGRVNSAFGAHQPGNCSLLNQAVMELGAVICTPRQPQCARCPARRFCLARKLDRASEFPNLGPRQATTFRRMAALVLEHRGRVLVRQRPAGVLNGHL